MKTQQAKTCHPFYSRLFEDLSCAIYLTLSSTSGSDISAMQVFYRSLVYDTHLLEYSSFWYQLELHLSDENLLLLHNRSGL